MQQVEKETGEEIKPRTPEKGKMICQKLKENSYLSTMSSVRENLCEYILMNK